ncbi:MAG: DUF2179 domain-containing protein [Candidatus Promineofilum sp.]|nr:DUF2179 domain-containing protein [Promineifilum sp.]
MFAFDIPPLTSQVLFGALFIFALRVIGITISTVRVLIMMRGKKAAAFVAGFFEVLTYVVAIAEVVNNLDNVWNVLGYCLGFSVGTLLGMMVDERTATGFTNIRVISRYKAQSIIEAIHEAGHGATVGWGHGRGGTVGMIVAVVRRKETDLICDIVETIDPNAFITIEDARSVRRGHMQIGHHEK